MKSKIKSGIASFVLLLVPFLASCSKDNNNLPANQGPGLYKQVVNLSVKSACRVTITPKTVKHGSLKIDGTSHTSGEDKVYEVNDKLALVIESLDKETNLNVTYTIKPISLEEKTRAELVIKGYLNNNEIVSEKKFTTLEGDTPLTTTVALGK